MLFFLIFILVGKTNAQINLSGKTGLIYTPNALESTDGNFRIGYNYNPIKYALRKRGNNPERIIYANLTILKRLEINANLVQVISTETHKVKEAIGDRQLDLKYLILKEKAKQPSLAVILTTPFTIDGAMLTHALVATKHFQIQKNLKIETNLGFGSPYYLFRNESNLKNNNMFSNFKWQKKSEDRYKNHYLEGPFGGIGLHYKTWGGLMAEWDSQHVNTGAYVRLFKCWTIQAGMINFDQLTVGTSVSINLIKKDSRSKSTSDE